MARFNCKKRISCSIVYYSVYKVSPVLFKKNFTGSLHSLSIWRGIQASISRNPNKVAITCKTSYLTYGDIGSLINNADQSKLDSQFVELMNLLQTLSINSNLNESCDEDSNLIGVKQNISERELGLSILNISVCHPIFTRNSVSAVPFSIQEPCGVVATFAPLLLGGTLCLIEKNNIESLVSKISDGFVTQAWLSPTEYTLLDKINLHTPHLLFQGLICIGLPSQSIRKILIDWVGLNRAHAIDLNADLMPWARYPNLMNTCEPYPGYQRLD